MTTAWIIAGIVLVWYCIKENQKNKPNWKRAFLRAAFWPLSLLINPWPKEGKEG